MFERFTERARKALVLAQEEARVLEHDYIGTEHILLGLMREREGVAAKSLESLGIGLGVIRDKVQELSGPMSSPPSGSPPFTPRSKKVLELALREALTLGHNYIGTEHILLAIVREGDGVGAKALVAAGAELPSVRQQVLRLLSGYTGSETRARPAPPVEPHTEPGCQHCGAAMPANARSRLLLVPDDEDGPPVEATVVYCGACGRGIGAHVEAGPRPTLPGPPA